MDNHTLQLHKFKRPVDSNIIIHIGRRESGIRFLIADELSDAKYIGKTVAECRQSYDNVRVTNINGVAQIGIQNMDPNRLNLTVVGQCDDLGQNPCFVQTHCVDSLVVTGVSWH